MDFWDSVFRMLSALAVVLGLMMVVVAVTRRVMGARFSAHADAPLVRVLSTGYVGPRKTISVVSVAGELLIIGATATDLIPLGRLRLSAEAKAKVQAEPTGPMQPDVPTRCTPS
jgi:flagellar protein FliO/FliZ